MEADAPLRHPSPQPLQQLTLPLPHIHPECRRPAVIPARIADEGRDVRFELSRSSPKKLSEIQSVRQNSEVNLHKKKVKEKGFSVLGNERDGLGGQFVAVLLLLLLLACISKLKIIVRVPLMTRIGLRSFVLVVFSVLVFGSLASCRYACSCCDPGQSVICSLAP
jgi:hypothetical protein